MRRGCAEAYVANGLQLDPAQYATRTSCTPAQFRVLRPETDEVIGTQKGNLVLSHQVVETESLEEGDGYCGFIVRATSAIPITMSVGYAIWILSEESLVAHRLLSSAIMRYIDPLKTLNLFAESKVPLHRESDFDRRPLKWIP